eukprot:25483-Rhodomonas_salina.1
MMVLSREAEARSWQQHTRCQSRTPPGMRLEMLADQRLVSRRKGDCVDGVWPQRDCQPRTSHSSRVGREQR